jgi:diguanylate cyclase (GGDEF)-like protein/PAS domain S-box-containing protein
MSIGHRFMPTERVERRYFFALLLALCLVVTSFLVFISNIEEYRRRQETERLAEIADMCAVNAKDRFSLYVGLVSAAARQVQALGGLNPETAAQLLKQASAGTDFTAMAIIFPDGTFFTTDGGKIPPPDLSYFSDRVTVRTRTMNGVDYISIAVPITRGRTAAANIRGLIPKDRLRSVIDQKICDGRGYIHLMTGGGDFILKSVSNDALCRDGYENINIFDLFKRIGFRGSITLDDLRSAMAKGEDISFIFAYNGETRVAHIKPVGIEDWRIGVFVPGQYAAIQTEEIKKDSGLLVLMISFVISLMFLYILFNERRATSSVRSANLMTEALVSNIPGGVFKCAMDEMFTVEYISAGFAVLTGHTLDEASGICGGSFWDSIHPDDMQRAREDMISQLKAHGRFYVTYRMTKKDGSVIHVLNKGGMLGDEYGLGSAYGVVVDISETHLAIEKLKANEKKYETALKEANIMTFEYDGLNDVLHNSETLSEKLGVPRVTEGFMASENPHGAHLLKLKEMIAALAPGNASASSKYYCNTESGVFYIETRVAGSFDAEGRLINAIGTAEDITQQKEMELRWIKAQKYKNTLSKLYDTMFEFDITNDRIITGRGHLSGYAELSDSYGEIIESFAATSVHSDDRDAFLSLFSPEKVRERYENGMSDCDVDFRAVDQQSGAYRWKSAHATLFADPVDNTLHLICFVKDIHEDKERIDRLFEMADKDPLTGLCNRRRAEELISAKLAEDRAKEPRPMNALMVIDLDNFKSINDFMGHLFGDTVLVEASSQLSETFRSTDVIGRIGGDEFIVFMKDIPNIDIAVRKAEAICENLRKLHGWSKGKISATASVGIAFSPNDGDDFSSLYNKADIALYHSKNSGKSRVTVYKDEMCGTPMQIKDAALIDDAGNTAGLFFENPERHIFRILYNAKDLEIAIKSVIELVVRRFGFSRGYIFENSPDNMYFSETFEVCNDGVEPTAQDLQNVPYATRRPDYHLNFDENGVFLLDMRTYRGNLYREFEKQGITSLIQVIITEKGTFRGFIGFDCCDGKHKLTSKDISSVVLSGQIIAAFAAKEHERRKKDNRARAAMDAVSRLALPALVVDAENCEILFANKYLLKMSPNIKTGDKCYKALFGVDSRCEVCPLRESMTGGASGATKYVPAMRKSVEITALPVDWPGHANAYLITLSPQTEG